MNILIWAFRSFKNPCFLDIVIPALVSDNFATKMFCLLQFVILYDLFSKLPSSNFHLEFLHKTFIIEYLKTGKNYDSINQIQDWIWIFCLKVFWISSFSNKFLDNSILGRCTSFKKISKQKIKFEEKQWAASCMEQPVLIKNI